MADRIFKGRLLVTEDIQTENEVFSEASGDFQEPHKGNLDPMECLRKIFSYPKMSEINDSIWVHGTGEFEGLWLKIDPNGDMEIGASGV